MNLVTIPAGLLALSLLLVAAFAALVGHSITRWIYRDRERKLDDLQARLNVLGDGPGYGSLGAPFVPGELAALNARASQLLVNGRPR